MGKFLKRLALRFMAGYAVAEVSFQTWKWWRYTHCNREPEEQPDVAAVPAAMERFFTLHGVIDIRAFFSGWFHDAPFESIWRENVEDFAIGNIYCRKRCELTPLQLDAVAAFLDRIERTWGLRFQPGRNPGVVPMLHLHEPLRVLPVPLIVYLASELCSLAVRAEMYRQGFQKSRAQGFSFWVRLPAGDGKGQKHSRLQISMRARAGSGGAAEGSTQTIQLSADGVASEGRAVLKMAGNGGSGSSAGGKRPLVVLHGVGWGLFPYLRFVQRLRAAAPGHPVVVAEARHISLRLCGGLSPPVNILAHAVLAVLRRHGLGAATFLGHSYGTFAVSRLRQLHPEVVHSTALLDPVCMMTCAPHLLHNFIYRSPQLSRAKSLGLNMLELLRYMCSRDLMIASAFCRGFYWHELMLWPEQLPPGGALVSLSGCDTLVPVELITAQLKAADSSARLLHHTNGGHGGFLFDMRYQACLIKEVCQLLRAP